MGENITFIPKNNRKLNRNLTGIIREAKSSKEIIIITIKCEWEKLKTNGYNDKKFEQNLVIVNCIRR